MKQKEKVGVKETRTRATMQAPDSFGSTTDKKPRYC